jgi:GH24 family phage-related lysozyme (muramidase)
MDNRFLEMDKRLKHRQVKARTGNGSNGYGGGTTTMMGYPFSVWAQPFAAADRTLVILIENGGVDLGIPALVDGLLSAVPGSSLIPNSYRQDLIDYVRQKIRGFTDNLLETLELSINRYTAAKPEFFGDVVVLRDGTSSYRDLKNKLLSLSRAGKIVDLIILTHGSSDYISVPGGINAQKIRAMKTENGGPLTIRSVYMMNCVGSSLNQAWIDAGAKVSSGALRNNYLPEPTTFFFWKNWKEGQTFESAATSAYRKTINLMNAAVRSFVSSLPITGSSILANQIDFENMDFVRDSAPVIQGQRSVTINTDDLAFTQSMSSSLATTVLPVGLLHSLGLSQPDAGAPPQTMTLSQQGVDLIKGWEGFRATMYNDPVGHCTIGYGTLVHMGNCDGRPAERPYANGVTEEKATQLLAQKAAEFAHVVNDHVHVALNQNQFDALVSFVYNIGPDNFKRSTLLRLLNQGNYASAPVEMRKWVKARQNGALVDLPGLVKRRAAEADLFQKPVAVNGTAQSLTHYLFSSQQTAPTHPAIAKILEHVGASGLVGYGWKDRGVAPIGYLKGMALTYARVYCKFKVGPGQPENARDPFVEKMAKGVAPGANTTKDAIARYANKLTELGADVSVDGVDVLRGLFTILFGLGMRESSGKHCTGWDRRKTTGWGNPDKAVTPTAANSEAGLFQISYDMGVGAPGDFKDLYQSYKQRPASGFLDVFSEGVTCKTSDAENFGGGAGKEFQRFSKDCPAFTVELAALGLRTRANHWGPIRRNTAEILPQCWSLLRQVEKAIDDLGGCNAVSGSNVNYATGTSEPAPASPSLTLGQKVPNKKEVDVVGAITAKVVRGTPEFAALVENKNPDIVFKDEEKTGADRMMTPKLEAKLKVLADLVKKEWPGQKLRVTEAWDENNEHAANSIHYEGRAADMTVSDRDAAKLGRLGQLAVDAGFDWVWYENALHVHASVAK